ncbi:hypothetical protein M9H77_17352 [Catharanthus roseus]|uniref:Uncharacterized protein n=1 Tax=Catharanthus roseus TaxID=4058 RepID=A0ACC0B4C7_CATRO|nr:hypothetical protein M9H77_17352 [Catharanthus roseus]
MVHGSKKRAHPETSTPPAAASIPPGMSPSLAAVSTPQGMSIPPAAASTPLATLTPFPQLLYSSLAPTSTLSSDSSTARMSSSPALSSSTRPSALAPHSPLYLSFHPRVFLTLTSLSYRPQLDIAKLITEIMKAHLVEAHPSFWKVSDRIKNMWYTKFGKRYRWDPMHERAILDAWQKQASLRYKDLMYEVGIQEEARGGTAESAIGAWWPGAWQAHRWDKYQELKANAKRLHIETGSPILNNEQLMFEAAGGSNNGHVYGVGS